MTSPVPFKYRMSPTRFNIIPAETARKMVACVRGNSHWSLASTDMAVRIQTDLRQAIEVGNSEVGVVFSRHWAYSREVTEIDKQAVKDMFEDKGYVISIHDSDKTHFEVKVSF